MMARRTATDDLRPETINRVHRARIESLRAEGRYRELVLWLIGDPDAWQRESNGVFESRAIRARPDVEPMAEDLAGALREVPTGPLPAPIREWIIARYILKTERRKRGTKTSARSPQDDDQLFQLYTSEYLNELDAYDAREAPPLDRVKAQGVATQAKKRTEKKSGWSGRTIDAILAARQVVKSPAEKVK